MASLNTFPVLILGHLTTPTLSTNFPSATRCPLHQCSAAASATPSAAATPTHSCHPYAPRSLEVAGYGLQPGCLSISSSLRLALACAIVVRLRALFRPAHGQPQFRAPRLCPPLCTCPQSLRHRALQGRFPFQCRTHGGPRPPPLRQVVHDVLHCKILNRNHI